ncbi:hypothetical protein Tco_1086008 [Tanacetum coccineum]
MSVLAIRRQIGLVYPSKDVRVRFCKRCSVAAIDRSILCLLDPCWLVWRFPDMYIQSRRVCVEVVLLLVRSLLSPLSLACGVASSKLRSSAVGLSKSLVSVSSGSPMLPSPISNSHDEKCWTCCFSCSDIPGHDNRMFWRRVYTLKPVHRYDAVMDASIIYAFEAFFLTGNVFLKSPLSIMVLPPNKVCGLSKMSLRKRLRASNQRRSFIGASSQMIRSVSLNENSNDAILEDATANTILSSKRMTHAMEFHRKLLPVPPWPYTNISFCSFLLTAFTTSSSISFWSSFSFGRSASFSISRSSRL